LLILVFRDVTPYGLVDGYQHHGGNCYFHLQSRRATLLLRWSQERFLRYTLMPTYLPNRTMSHSTSQSHWHRHSNKSSSRIWSRSGNYNSTMIIY